MKFLIQFLIDIIADKSEGVHKISRTIIKKHGAENDGLYIYLEVIIEFGHNINDTMTALKKQITKEIEKMTSMNVLSMEIVVKGVNLERK